jgi:hypothetical protein
LAYAVVLSGVRQADAFYATAWMSTRAADHANLPGLREVLLRHPKRYPSYSDRFEADGLHGGRLVRNFLTTTANLNLKTDWITKSFGFSTQADWITKSFWFSTNDQGFPPVAEGMLHYDVPKPVGTFRVVVLGGSTVEGWGVNSPLESFPAKLQALLAAALAEHPAEGVQRVEVINAGVSNYASDDEYLYLLADLLPFQPDLVIAYDG